MSTVPITKACVPPHPRPTPPTWSCQTVTRSIRIQDLKQADVVNVCTTPSPPAPSTASTFGYLLHLQLHLQRQRQRPLGLALLERELGTVAKGDGSRGHSLMDLVPTCANVHSIHRCTHAGQHTHTYILCKRACRVVPLGS